ncbi:MAG: glucose-1-phosphate thymidylyltransferase [Anaerolineaceae bacterium]
MKGVVLAGGKGSRLRPFTYSGAKQLVPVANTPVLHFPVRQLVEAGITEIALVVGDTESQIREAMGDGSAFGARFTYIRQAVPLGIAHGALVCRDFVGSDSFVLYLGDNVLQGGIQSFVERFAAESPLASVILRTVDDPRAFGVAEMLGERLIQVVEKPAAPPSSLAVIGVYAFTPSVFRVIEKQSPSARGELEIADAINGLLALGVVTATVTEEFWIDTGKMEDILAANRVLLDRLPMGCAPSAVISHSAIIGTVQIGAGSVLEGCTVHGPVSIGSGSMLTNSVVGPHVSIGDDCEIRSVTIENSIVMDRSVLARSPGIHHSVIGRDTFVTGAPTGAILTLGDHSRFEANE